MTPPFRAAAALLLCAIAGGACVGTPERIVLHNVTLFDGTGAAPHPAMVVAMRGDRIDAVEPVATFEQARGDRVIDGTGRFVIPGLWDLHVHLSDAKAEALPLLVANGVTSVRDMGGDLDELRGFEAEIAAGYHVGPRIFMAGPMLEAPATLERIAASDTREQFRTTRIAISDTARARVVVDSLADLGVDFVKIREYADEATYGAVVNAARARGLAVAGHAPFSMDPIAGAALGLASLEHASYPYPLIEDAGARKRLLDAFRESGVAIVPTLAAWETNVMDPDSLAVLVADTAGARDPRVRLLSRFLLAEWRRDVAEIEPRSSGYYTGYRGFIERQSADLKAMHDAGIPILPGSDLAGAAIFPGWSLHDELERLVTWVELTPGEAIVAATRRPAELLGVADSIGTIESGKVADLVLLDADPLTDIRNTRRIHAVIARGAFYGPDIIRELLDGLHPTSTGGIRLIH